MKFDLTVVATARNDNHGGNLRHRMLLFVNGLLRQCQRHQLKAELILVEWNPPADNPPLAEVLSWPVDDSPCLVRIIQVPSEIHQRFKHSDHLPLFQMIAKNVGIRRACGQYVLATNIDILFSDDLMKFLASGRLQRGYMYRLDRYDVPADISLESSIEAQLEYCRKNVIRLNALEGTHNFQSGHYHPVYPQLTWRTWLSEKLQDWRLRPIINKSRLHTNACGDFTLMAREHWFDVRGYPEFEMYSLHLDSILCHAAYHSGVQEYILGDPVRIYHIEHATGSGWTPEGARKLAKRLNKTGIPQLDHNQFTAWTIQMRRERKHLVFNEENWGLVDEHLSETIISEGADVLA